MAFHTNGGKSATGSSTTGAWEQAKGFINLYVLNNVQTEVSLGMLALKASNAGQNSLCDRLSNDVDFTDKDGVVHKTPVLNWVLRNLQVTYRASSDGGELDFLDKVEPAEPAEPTNKLLGYLNFSLPDEAGGRSHVGFVALKSDVPRERILASALKSQPVETLEKIQTRLRINFRLNQKKPAVGFAILKAA